MKIKIIYLLTFLVILPSIGFGQEIHSYLRPIDSLASIKDGSFSSVEAGFSISLPKEIGGFSGRNGIEYHWRLNEGYYFAGIKNKNNKIENTEAFETETSEIIKESFANTARDYFASKYEVKELSKDYFELQGHKGLKFRAVLSDTIFIMRVVWVEDRAYKVGVLLSQEQQKFENKALEVLDSLKIFTENAAEELLRRKIEENTPKSLPQVPVAKKLKSDAEDEGLKGKVKSVTEEKETVKEGKITDPRHILSENIYNEQGNLIKTLSFNSNGLPWLISSYGYIDGFRVSNSKFISYESSPPPRAVPASPEPPKKSDSRYQTKYIYKYDIKGNLRETANYNNKGELISRTVYTRSENRIEVKNLKKDDSISSRNTYSLDDKELITENIIFDVGRKGRNFRHQHSYNKFDENENWIKRTTIFSIIINNEIQEEYEYVTYRKIQYF